MPRLPPTFVRQVRRASCHLADLLIATRDLDSAKNELRWLQEHIATSTTRHAGRTDREHGTRGSSTDGCARSNARLKDLCCQRRRGVPLQYLLGSEHFGDLEIACRPGVLIPRQDTASIVTHLAQLISTSATLSTQSSIRILDLCTGTGCILLLLHHLLSQNPHFPPINSLGIDLNPHAISLARHNLSPNANAPRKTDTLTFVEADVLSTPLVRHLPPSVAQALTGARSVDILTSNPPYISPRDLYRTTARSVRLFEPRAALVPSAAASDSVRSDSSGSGSNDPAVSDAARADVFYGPILDHARELHVGAVLLEVGCAAQGLRVALLARGFLGCGHAQTLDPKEDTGFKKAEWRVQIWRDEPGVGAADGTPRKVDGVTDSREGMPGRELDDGDDAETRTVVARARRHGFTIRGRGNVRAVFAYDESRGWFPAL